MLERLGVDLRPMPRPLYMKPYPDWIDKLYPFPRGYKVPEFSLFSGEEKGQSTVEHVARFSAQCGEAAAHDFWKLRLFASSLTKMAFTWAPPDVTLADLARISQLPSESAEKYIGRFRNLRTRCSTKMSEADCVPMVVRGMSFAMREHFEGHSEDSGSEDEVNMAEFLGTKPLECSALRKPGFVKKNKTVVVQNEYSFDLTKADDIFDALLKDGQISLSEGHTIPPSEELVGKDYCKYHNSWRHSTNNCVNFRNVIKKAISEGKLLFPTKKRLMLNTCLLTPFGPTLIAS
ncbi:uncharacterized protein LOC126678335 [Mercurialis annua]|uniref:uncharacterized protein LOC126678335 n=1 Tax=Mercurialis annua TaxID=3986 RepID=UPI00215F815C|nr:uncharacterized protein LOC126678335 [Mercurialis annua]